MTGRKLKVAIVGGGCAGVTAAFELTRPQLRDRYEVTIYQLGFRLGGKGASGRGVFDRIEEHGLHLWMGFYENAFRLMRECYDELARDPARCPIATMESAFSPCPDNAVADAQGDIWSIWRARFPPTPGEPGAGTTTSWTIGMYLGQCVTLVRTLLESIEERDPHDSASGFAVPNDPIESMSRLLQYGALAGLAALREALDLLAAICERMLPSGSEPLLNLLDAIRQACAARIARLIATRPALRRVWEIIDLLLATVRGCLRHRLLVDPRGFDAIDEYDCREWLRENGAEASSLDCAFVRALYDLAFAYEDGDVDRPRIAAGQALRGALRAFFTYRGAFFYRMNAGMGDVVFAPYYELLVRRGVKFAFFHKLTNLGLGPADESDHVATLDFDVQAELIGGQAYRPLIDVRGLPCWPAQPLYDQLLDGEALRAQRWDGEAFEDRRKTRSLRLVVGRDFDFVVLAVGVGAVPYVTRELSERDPCWRAMLQRTASVATQALQLWLTADAEALGCGGAPLNLSGFVEPFDTWADMTHLGASESWPTRPASIAYFCSVLPETVARSQDRHERVFEHARHFLDSEIGFLWPRAQRADGGFRWKLLLRARPGRTPPREHPLRTQYWRANVQPSDRYALSLPGSLQHRVSPLDDRFDNLTVCGDWTQCGFNEGCVEAAVMSGRLAAHALSGHPALEEIVGYDHP